MGLDASDPHSLAGRKVNRRYAVISVVVIILAGAAVIYWLAASGSPAEPAEPVGARPDSGSESWKRISDAGVSETRFATAWPYSSLDRSDVRMPAGLRSSAQAVLGEAKALWLQFDHSSVAPVSSTDVLWVVPGRGVICTFKPRPMAAACATRKQAIQHVLLLGTYTPDPRTKQPESYLSIGLVPDMVRSVTIKVGGATRRIRAHRDVFLVRSKAPVQVMSTHTTASRSPDLSTNERKE